MNPFILLACMAISAATGSLSNHRHRKNDVSLSIAKPFTAENVYRFIYDSQISSSLGLTNFNLGSQQATLRFSSIANVHFETDRSAFLQLEDIRVASLNGELSEIHNIQPMQLFNNEEIDSKKLEQLQMPCKFEFVDGLVERIYFSDKDTSWSKNIKRAVLNLIQINLKERNSLETTEFEQQQSRQDVSSLNKVFDVKEVTLEGECKTSYTVNKLSNNDKDNEVLNVTKTIHFLTCFELPSIYYGPRIQKSIHTSNVDKLEEQQIDRSTTIRYHLVGSEDKYGVANVEILSQYVYNALGDDAMQTVVAGRLVIESVQQKSESFNASSRDYSKEESLLYSMEWDILEKRFYQYGDEEFTNENSPFARVEDKVTKILSLIIKIAESTEDKTHGIETETIHMLQQTVKLLRMCSLHDIKQLFAGAESYYHDRVYEILVDACAIAGTRNTIHFLVERIQKGDITPTKAVVILHQFSSLPAISEKQVTIVLGLCQHGVMEKSAALRQACWLTAGSMISEVCKKTVEENQMCPRSQKVKYEQILWDQFKGADSHYEKVLAIKAIGNAALDVSIQNLERVIVDRKEFNTIRVQAIDAFRRLRKVAPRKIQTILLPLFTDAFEEEEVRMYAFSMLMHTIPKKDTMDSIAYTLLIESSPRVRSFVFSCFKAYSVSPIPEERELAIHLRAILLMVDVDFNGTSSYYRFPIYSSHKHEGLFFNWISIFSTADAMPNYMAVSLDSLFNGLLEKDSVSISLTQNNIETLYHQIMETLYGMTSENNDKIRARRSSRRSGEEEIGSIFDDLKIKARESFEKNPFGLINLRIRDVDQVIIPLGEEYMPTILKSLLNGERLSAKSFDSSIFQGKQLKFASALSFHERSLKIATSSGMPLRVMHTLPVVASMDGEVKFEIKSSTKYLATIKVQPLISGVHTCKMELWCPFVNTGVESLRSFEFNLPIDMKVIVTPYEQEKVKLILNVPERKTRLVGLRSLPITFTRQFDAKKNLHGKANVKSIRNIIMEPRIVELDSSRSSTFFKIEGNYHVPAEMSYSGFMNMLWTTENNLHIKHIPTSRDSIDSIEMTITASAFERVESSTAKPSFEEFYENNKKFKSFYDEDVEGMDGFNSYNESQTRLNNYLNDEYKPRSSYRHMLQTSIKTVGGSVTHQASAQITAICDTKMSFCKVDADLQRTPILVNEKVEWKLKVESQILLPEYVSDVSEFNSSKFFELSATVKVEWGSHDYQKINLRLQGQKNNGMKSITDEWHETIDTVFINKFKIIINYNINISSKTKIENFFDFIRYYFGIGNYKFNNGIDDEVYVYFIIDPVKLHHFNVSLITPSEQVRFTNVQIPMAIKPFNLVQSQQQGRRSEIHSIEDAATEYADSSRAECRIYGRRIKTFDAVTYKAPIGTCYSLVAGDCAKKSFVVLMKSISEDTDAKALKIVTAKKTIEIELIRNKLIVKINGEKLEDIDQLREQHDIDYSEDYVRCNLPQGVSIRFDGKQASIKMSHYYKNSQCGLCGHFDGEGSDEFRMNDNTLTDDVKDFHRSYSMVDDECRKFFDNKTLYGFENEDPLYIQNGIITKAHTFPYVVYLKIMAGVRNVVKPESTHQQQDVKEGNYERLRDDGALIHLPKLFKEDGDVKTVQMKEKFDLPIYTEMIVTGWGNIDAFKQPEVLYYANVKLLDKNVDYSQPPHFLHCSEVSKTESYHICLANDDRNMASCPGDSGGPVILRIGTKDIQVGLIVAGPDKCVKTNAAFTDALTSEHICEDLKERNITDVCV